MSDPSQIRAGMPVIASDGTRVGTVDAVEGGDTIKLKRNDSPDGEHHRVPLSAVERVDEHVHLNQAADAVRSGWGTAAATTAGGVGVGAAAATTTTTNTGHGASHVRIEKDEDGGGASWIPWLLGALALLALLIFGVRGCDEQERAVAPAPVEQTTTTTTTTNSPAAGATARTENVVLPNGQTLAVAPATLNYDLQQYLASGEAAPRTFTFDRVHFPSASAEVIPAERGDIDNLGRILQAYPNARIRIVGYTDARGSAPANAQLGAQRARAVATLLTGSGIAADRVETASGGEADPAETNATTVGQAENRRTEVVVTAK